MNFELARYALTSVQLAPASPLQWQNLCRLVQVLEADEQTLLIDEIERLPLVGWESLWLRCSALAFLTRNPVWFARQAALATAQTPPDAVMAMLGLAWHHALARTLNQHEFVQLLQNVNAAGLQRLVAQRMPTATRPHRVSGPKLRVAIYTPQVVGSKHGGSTLALNVMSVLVRAGADLKTFTAQETTISEANSQRGGAEFLAQQAVQIESLVLNAPGLAQLMLPDGQFSLRVRFEQMLSAIRAYEPDLLVFVGFMSPLVYRLYENYPVLGLSLHSLPPIVPADVWLSAQPDANAALWPDLPTPQVAHYPFRFWPKGTAQAADLSSIGLPASALVLLTAGARLAVELTSPWQDRMLAFIEANANVHWLVIGVPAGTTLVFAGHPRVHVMAPQMALETWLAAADIYLNPPRMGGGGTVAMAMEQGLPVVSFTGGDGGDKVGGFAVSSLDQYFDRLLAWVTDSAARAQVGSALKQDFHRRLDIELVPKKWTPRSL